MRTRSHRMGMNPRCIAVWMKRSDKTFYFFQQVKRLIDRGLPRQHIFYFDFSDDRLPAGECMMDEALEEYRRHLPSARMEGAYPFLDEARDCEGWQGTYRRVAEFMHAMRTSLRNRRGVSSFACPDWAWPKRFLAQIVPKHLRQVWEATTNEGGSLPALLSFAVWPVARSGIARFASSAPSVAFPLHRLQGLVGAETPADAPGRTPRRVHGCVGGTVTRLLASRIRVS